MADYFTSDHFKLLNKWKGQKRDESNPEQNRAYEDLKKAYEVTQAWANQVQAALSDLPERQREALVLCHFQEMSNLEAAELMGVSVEALESLLSRGRRGLRARLQEHRADYGRGAETG